MRLGFSIIFGLSVVALIYCMILARRSKKSIGASVAMLLAALTPPVIGNMIIIGTSNQHVAFTGYYIYFLGMDVVMLAALRYAMLYCQFSWKSPVLKVLVHGLFAVDVLQYILNPFFHQAFTIESTEVSGSIYYRMIPFWGQTFHRILDYGVFAVILLIFLVKWIKVPRIYAEKYYIIFFAMVLVGIWETAYIFSRTPVDRSMIGFSAFGFLVFYFSLYYRPMRLLDRMLANIASEMPEALYFFDGNGQCIWANEPAIKLAGIQEKELEEAAVRLRRIFGSIDREEEEWSTRYVTGQGDKARYFVLERHTVKDAKGKVNGSFLSIRDNTEEQMVLERQRYKADHDPLTDLYNREYLYKQIRKALDENPEQKYYIVYLDVKDFKMVNDIYGNDFGDYVLRSIANRIRLECHRATIYGRLVGDIFGLCIPDFRFNPEFLTDIMTHFLVKNGAREVQVIMHMGVYEVVERDIDVSVMFDRARMAELTIKDDLQNFLAYYDDRMREEVLWERSISEQLGQALEEGQIRPYLQPIVDAEGNVVGAEALVRWIHPENGLLSPGRFIPVFEKNGMIAEVDRFMWRSACEILARWRKEGKPLFLSVNISAKDFYFMDVDEVLEEMVREYGVTPARLRLEITESVMMTDIEQRLALLNRLREDGFIVEMDDFGSGYSSMNMLKDMPIDVLKIDMVFLRKTRVDEKAQTILKNIIRLSDELGMDSLTEGVESEEHFRMLADMGCRLFQGYYFAKPLPVEEFEAYYENQRNS